MSIETIQINKTFGGVSALKNVQLNVRTGTLVALVGPSGSGKTTLLRILAGLESPDSGSGAILFHGEDVSLLSARARRVGMVFQHYALFRHMNVAQNIAFGLTVLPRKERPCSIEISQKVDELLSLIQLDGYRNHLPHQLSGGQRQRVALARALAVEPRILLLDEPFGALDAKVRKDLRKWLRQFHEKIGVTTVFVTHDQEEALELADEVVVMNHACVEQVGSPQEVFDHPASPFVIEFMGNVNRLRGPANLNAGEGHLYVRPHDIDILPVESGHGLRGKILHIFSAGSVGKVTLRTLKTGELIEAEISRVHLSKIGICPGDEAFISFRHIRVFSKEENSQRVELVQCDEIINRFSDV